MITSSHYNQIFNKCSSLFNKLIFGEKMEVKTEFFIQEEENIRLFRERYFDM